MKNSLILATLFFFNLSFSQKGSVINQNSIGLQNAINEIKLVTEELSNSGKIEGDFDVSVKFNNVVTDETGFELSLFFLSFKRIKNKSIENTFTSKYKFTATKKKLITPYVYKQSLAEALNSGIEAYQNTDSGLLTKNGFNITMSFTISKSISGTGSYTITPITLGASRSRQKKSVHIISIDFTPKPID